MSANLFTKARQVNSTNSTLPTNVPTITTPPTISPTANGIQVFSLANSARKQITIIPCAVGADTNVMKFTLIGWAQTVDLLVPTALVTCAGTIASALPGFDGSIFDSTHFFVEALTFVTTLGSGALPFVQRLTGTTAGTVACGLVVDASHLPFDLFSIDFSNEGSSTSCNALLGIL